MSIISHFGFREARQTVQSSCQKKFFPRSGMPLKHIYHIVYGALNWTSSYLNIRKILVANITGYHWKKASKWYRMIALILTSDWYSNDCACCSLVCVVIYNHTNKFD